MNTRAKLTVVAMFSVFALASNPARADVFGFSGSLPSISSVTAEVTKIVAADLTASLRSALSAPRATRTHQSPSVTITEVVESAPMETVTVVASRLAPTIETVTVVASRLPPLATETLAQANTRTRL
jgi:hypothetical protein